jgi:16S rRNA (uracil1498-N3)-methyltransferase
MRTPRVYVDLSLPAGQRCELGSGAAQHLLQVLRLRPGAPLTLFNGDGRDYPGVLVEGRRGAAIVDVGEAGEPEGIAPLLVHLGIGVSRGERMDFAVQKAVELGVATITPLFTERSVVRLDAERLAKRQQHWRGVLIGACEQSGRRRLPILHASTGLGTWLHLPHPMPLLLDPRSPSALTDLPSPAGELTLLVGPEGGLAPRERAEATEAGFRGVHLGPRVLRTETAPLAALAAIQVIWGDMRS